jgi:hypothetical protein
MFSPRKLTNFLIAIPEWGSLIFLRNQYYKYQMIIIATLIYSAITFTIYEPQTVLSIVRDYGWFPL